MELLPTRTFDDLMTAVTTEEAEWAVVPVENTLAGSVQGNLDRLLHHALQVRAETRVRIRLSLAARPGTGLVGITTVASHPVALQQCRTFFREHPDMEPVAVYDTAGSVRDLMRGASTCDAAVASSFAAELYGATVLVEGMEDDDENFTRFFAVGLPGTPMPISAVTPGTEGKRPCPRTLKTSMAFIVPHEPGSLHQALGVFARRGLDLTKLESRPIPGRPWEYRFFADVRETAAGISETSSPPSFPPGRLESCLDELGELTSELRILGRYPEAGVPISSRESSRPPGSGVRWRSP